jgi:hypothetical protein
LGARYNDIMPYVIKASGRAGYVCWLGAPSEAGIRAFTPRQTASVFQTAADADAVIANLPRAFKEVGLIYSVESVD